VEAAIDAADHVIVLDIAGSFSILPRERSSTSMYLKRPYFGSAKLEGEHPDVGEEQD